MSYKQFLKKIALFQVRNPIITILIILAITIALYGGVADVRTVASLEQMMPKDIEEIRAFNELRDQNMGQDMVAIIISVNEESTDSTGYQDVRNQDVLSYAQHLQNLVRSEADIREVYAAPDILLGASAQAGYAFEDVSQIPPPLYEQLLQNPELQTQLSSFINDDSSITLLIASTDVSANDPRMGILAENLINHLESAGHPPGIKVSVTGTPIIQQKLGELIAQDRQSTQIISTVLVFLITMILFGTFTSALVPILVVTLSVNWLYGIMGYANIPISTLAGGVAAMVIGIGIDYAIHLMNKFKNERKQGKTQEQAVVIAVQDTGMALTGAAIATTLAFLAFLLGSMPEMNRFGLLMAIGVSSAFVLSIFGLPALLVVEERILERLRKRMHFGVEGEYSLYTKNEIHPDTHKQVEPSVEELKTLTQKYKICTLKKEDEQ